MLAVRKALMIVGIDDIGWCCDWRAFTKREAWALITSLCLHVLLFLLLDSGISRAGLSSSVGRVLQVRITSTSAEGANVVANDSPRWTKAPPDSDEHVPNTSRWSGRPELFSLGQKTWLANELDAPLSPLDQDFISPAEALPSQTSGNIDLALLINEDGQVVWLRINSSDIDERGTQLVEKLFRQTKFTVPTKDGRPVRALLNIFFQISEAQNPY